jgi:E3 ubiquitin-protein ligase NEDD4
MDAVSCGPFRFRAPTDLCRNNDITDALELTFATDDERFGETVSIELKPGGDNIEVTNENKGEYVE